MNRRTIEDAVANARPFRSPDAASGTSEEAAPEEPRAAMAPKVLEDFYHHGPDNRFLYLGTNDMWSAASVDQVISPWPKNDDNGKLLAPSKWLARHRSIDQLSWAPGRPQVEDGVSVRDGGYMADGKTRIFNLYRAASPLNGDPSKADPWLDHVHFLYPETADHIITFFAHCVQRPGEKINHALVLGGDQGIGKDSLLEPVKSAIGPWNWSEISPTQMLGRFNGWAKAVIVRVNEARDLGDADRFAFYDHSKVYIAAPPDVLRVDEKNIREHQVANVCRVVFTTNNKSDGIFLPADDRRHHVSWSTVTREIIPDGYFAEFYEWLAAGGVGHVAAYLRQLDLSKFNPKAPPVRTPAFYAIVQASQSPDDAELTDLLDTLGNPRTVTIEMLVEAARTAGETELADLLSNRKTRRSIPHKMERAGFEPVRNPDAADGLFKIDGRRRVVYAHKSVPLGQRIGEARRMTTDTGAFS